MNIKIKYLFLGSVMWILLSHNAFGQYQEQIRLHYSNEYGLGNNLFGFNLVGEYFLIDNLSFAPSATILFPATGKASAFNFNARYYFTEEDIQLYGLAGYGIFRRRYEHNPELNFDNRGSINLGAGVLYKIYDEIGLNFEIKVQPQNNGEVWLKLGMLYYIN
ncbi:porin family protein [Pleomorphovibrio marinus]|uniref:outer membrane beta-barrel protein n=1 Tax=Pleomorphovibrio marinus TaxID=2164132 RepID=UPI00130079B7|nr:outer membrane beta-barrel protein [Pleomorphovibrio marinus]